MRIIKNENKKAMISSAIFLIGVGLVMSIMGYAMKNDATAFLGISFSLLSVGCLFFIYNQHILTAKVIWGVSTPVLIFISPCLFSLSNPTTIFSYSFLYIGGFVYMAYFFHEEEKRYLWISTFLFFIGILFYDRILIYRNFSQSEYALFFNNNYVHFKVAQVIHFVSIVCLIVLLHRHKVKIERQLSDQIRKFQVFTSNLIFTSKNKIIHSGDLKLALEEILKNTAEVMDVTRIGVWEIKEESQHLDLVVGYDVLTKSFSYSHRLNYEDYPRYFKALLEEKIIMAEDVLQDPKTNEFEKSYIVPLGIKSMLDSPFFMDGKFKGVLCCEEQRNYKKWDEMDQLFSMSISKLISIAYYCWIKKEHYEKLEVVNKKWRK